MSKTLNPTQDVFQRVEAVVVLAWSGRGFLGVRKGVAYGGQLDDCFPARRRGEEGG